MKKSTKLGAMIAAGILALGLAGCAASADAKSGAGNTTARYVELPDGGEVLCVFWVPVDNTGVASSEGAQLSCDWVGVSR